MKIRVLGSYGSRLPGFHTSSFLIDDNLLLDAGTITSTLSLEEQAVIDHILLTHAHLDHVVDIAFLVDNVFTLRSSPLCIWGPEPVLDAVRRFMFNNDIWPDFTRIKSGDFPIVELCPLPEAGQEPITVAGIELRWQRTNHVVFTAGYCLTRNKTSVLFSSDTRETTAIWEMAKSGEQLSLAFVETSFPNRLRKLAEASGHLTPAMLCIELDKLDKPDVPVKIFHMKPQFLSEITAELDALNDSRLQILHGGEVFIV